MQNYLPYKRSLISKTLCMSTNKTVRTSFVSISHLGNRTTNVLVTEQLQYSVPLSLFPHLAEFGNVAHFKRFTFYIHLSAFPYIAYHFPRAPAHVRHDDAGARCRPDLGTARSCRCKNDTSVCQNHQSKERRCSQSGKRIVRLE